MRNQPGDHHYVPVWLLRRFCDAKGRLWWRRRDWPSDTVHPQSVESVFYRNHLNTLQAPDGSKDLHVEEALAKLDREISEVNDRLVTQCRQGHPPDLDEESRAGLYSYMFVQFKRSPDDMWPGEKENHDAYVAEVLQSSQEVDQVLKTKGLCLMSVPRNSALVVGSQVMLGAGAGRAGRLVDADHALAFPFASDVLLVLGNGSSRREHTVLSEDEVVSANRATAGYCQEIAGPDPANPLHPVPGRLHESTGSARAGRPWQYSGPRRATIHPCQRLGVAPVNRLASTGH